jgi:hypothetical protein
MLTKKKKTKVPGDRDRRWMSDDYFDLIVWYRRTGALYGFQLCYGKPLRERALTWIAGRGFSHAAVDSSDTRPLIRSRTPILLPDGRFPSTKVLRQFNRRGAALPAELRDLVVAKIREFSARSAS